MFILMKRHCVYFNTVTIKVHETTSSGVALDDMMLSGVALDDMMLSGVALDDMMLSGVALDDMMLIMKLETRD